VVENHFGHDIEKGIAGNSILVPQTFETDYRSKAEIAEEKPERIAITTVSFIKGNGIITYMEYIELKEARDSSKTAKGYAICAILLNVAAICVGIYFSINSKDDVSTLELNTKNIETQIEELKGEVILIENSLEDAIEIYKQK